MATFGTFAVLMALSGAPTAPVAVIEMFTSQGCSSCPPADREMRRLHRVGEVEGIEVIPLSFHVDYWNYIGWRDPFSDERWTLRQHVYARTLPSGVYTPQAVVNGKAHEVGSRSNAVERSIVRHAYRGVRTLKASATRSHNTLNVRLTGKPVDDSELLLFVVESGIETQVKSGENRGRRLKNDTIVRSMQPVSVHAPDGTFDEHVPIEVQPEWSNRLEVVALWQHLESRKIGDATRAAVQP